MTVVKQSVTFNVMCDSCLHITDMRFESAFDFDLMEAINKIGWKTIYNQKTKKTHHVCGNCSTHYKIVRSFVDGTEEDDETTPES